MRILIASLAILIGITSSAFATEYLSLMPDLPLPEGIAETKESSTSFDSPTGRIVASYAEGPLESKVVVDFYDQTLPQLGWEKIASGTYRRQNETLKIDVLGGEGGNLAKISFTLSAENQ